MSGQADDARLTPFEVRVPQARLDEIAERVRGHRFPEFVPAPGWELGTDMGYLKALQGYWLEQYDWRATESRLNSFPQYMADVDGQRLHLVHERGSGSDPMTVLLIHGWPGSILEFYDAIERLAHPERFGGDAEDGLNVVVPSLPGHGFSPPPPGGPIGTRRVAELLDQLVGDVLGYEGYIAQGGDWGSILAGVLGASFPRCGAVHTHLPWPRPAAAPLLAQSWDRDLVTDEELSELECERDGQRDEFAYSVIQSTKPKTLAYAMVDSPLGACAWLTEKYWSWTPTDGVEQLDELFTKEQIIANAMLYIVNDTIAYAMWMYAGGEEGAILARGDTTVDVPTAWAKFRDPLFPSLPRRLVASVYTDIVQETDHDCGSHFACLKEPALVSDDILEFGRILKARTGMTQVDSAGSPAGRPGLTISTTP